jgi:hypothetical protein
MYIYKTDILYQTMFCEEQIPLERLQYAYSISRTKYSEYGVFDGETTEKDKVKWMKVIKNYLTKMILSKGFYSYNYYPSLISVEGECGRLFGKGSIQNIHHKIRALLTRGYTTDIDMKNAHCVIAYYLAQKYDIPCEYLSKYIHNRDEILSKYGKEYKTIILQHLNKDSTRIPSKYPVEIRKIIEEFKPIREKIIQHPDFQHIKRNSDDEDEWNLKGSQFNRVLCFYEAKILRIISSVILSKNIKIMSYMFDGLLVYGNHYSDLELLKTIEDTIETEIPDMNMKLAFKQHDNTIPMDDTFEVIPVDKFFEPEVNTFENVCAEFEKNKFKVINKACFVTYDEDTNELYYKKEKDFKVAYNHITYQKIVENKKTGENKITEEVFVDDWIKGYKHIRLVRDIDVYPPPLVCPSDMFNLWFPYRIEGIKSYIPNIEGRDFILNHLKIVSGNDPIVYDYFIKWIGQLLKFPGVKSGKCPVFVGQEGSGKGTIYQILSSLCGREKCYMTPEPHKYVYGMFNNIIENKILVAIDECEKKTTKDHIETFKNFITERDMTINQKNFDIRKIQSFHRYIIFTNNEEPIIISDTDRRFFVVRVSDEKVGEFEYFNKLYAYLEDDNTMKTLYDYLIELDGLEDFRSLPMPITDLKKSIQSITKEPLKLWIDDLISSDYKDLFERDEYTNEISNFNDGVLLTNSRDLYEHHVEWLKRSGYSHSNIIFNSFRVRFSRIKHPNFEFGHTKAHRFIKITVENEPSNSISDFHN